MTDIRSGRITVMKRTLPVIAMLLVTGIAGSAFAQTNPAPAQAGDDPSMAKPEGSTQPALQAPAPAHNPESTVGLAPTDQPVNNVKPRVAGEVVPSSQETAAHNPSIFEHDKQPIITHTFNFTAEQKQAIVDALAQEKGVTGGSGVTIAETMVVPPEVALQPIPDRISQAMPWVKPYLYLKTGNRIAIVDPHVRYVAAVIE
jgi:hypothetical protein